MSTCASNPGNRRKTEVNTHCSSPTPSKSSSIQMNNFSKNTINSTTSRDRETLLLMVREQKFDEFEQLINSRDNFQDFIHVYPDPDNGTLLDIACRSVGNSRIIEFLLDRLAEPNVVNEITGRAPIHEVIKSGDVDMLEVLVKHYNFDSLNVVDREGYTPLHIAAAQNHVRSIRILLDNSEHCRSQIDINMSTRENPSPLHLALKKSNLQAACVLLQCSGIDLDFQKNSEGRTCRQIIQQEYPHLEAKLSTDPLQHPGYILRSFLTRGLTELFITLASDVEPQFLNDDFHDDWSYLHHACNHGYTEVVEFLLENDVDPNKICADTMAIMLAAHNGYYNVFEKLFHHPKIELKKDGDGSVLHYIIRGMLYRGQVEERCDHHRCLELVLNEIFPATKSKSNIDKPLLDIDFVDRMGNTPLHLAVLFNDEQVHKSLIYAGSHLYREDSSGEVPLTLIKPTVLEDYLDDCITLETSNIETNREIIFNYKLFVKPSENSTCFGKEMEFFTIIEHVEELRKFLKHPLAESFLHIKWNFVKKYYWTNLLFYLVFCILSSSYIFQVHENEALPTDFSDPWFLIQMINRILTLLLYVILILRELCQLLISPMSYIRSPENWLEIIVIFATGTFLLQDNGNLSLAPICAASVILASWTELVFLIGKHPSFATNIEIFKTVAYNFSKFFALYSIMILSFGFSFYLLFHNKALEAKNQFSRNETGNGTNMNKDEHIGSWSSVTQNNGTNTTESAVNYDNTPNFWQSIPLSLFKTIIMLTGEFSTESIPLGSEFNGGHLFFILFVFSITIVLYNLLNGLAVSDTQAIREDAELVALASRVRLISQLEHLARYNPFGFRRYLSSSCCQCVKKLLERCSEFYKKAFCEDIQFYQGISCETGVAVRLHKNNMIRIIYKNKGKKDRGLMRMPTSIVKAAQGVLNNRSELDKIDESIHHLRVHGVKKPPPKFQSIDQLGQYFTTHMYDLEFKINETIAKRDEKLLENVKTLIEYSQSINYKEVTAFMETTIAQQMETLLESVMAGLQK